MAVPTTELWPAEEHTLAKHEILRRYMDAWFPILNRYNKELFYIDGFAGPGVYQHGEPGSPIIALKAASSSLTQLTGRLVFWFFEERVDRHISLVNEIKKLQVPKNFKIFPKCGTFNEEFEKVLVSIERAAKVPSFVFIDPFGYEGVDFSQIVRLMRCPSCEVFLTFMVSSLNRWLENDSVRHHIDRFFGTREAHRVADGPNRIHNLRLLYQDQLKNVAKARFVRYFNMIDKRNQQLFDLFFATNHPLGHAKMKAAMWRSDPDGRFQFRDGTCSDICSLFDEVEAVHIPNLAKRLLSRWNDGTSFLSEDAIKWTEDHTPYLDTHARAALVLLERDGLINVELVKRDGKRRLPGKFAPGTVISCKGRK